MGLFGFGRVKMPGVVYSEDWTPPESLTRDVQLFANYNIDNISHETRKLVSRKIATPEEEPYSWWERVGLFPIHPTRLRPRQYYYPVTDFRNFDYDDMSPEEQILKAKWLAALYEYDSMPGMMALFGLSCPSVFLPMQVRVVYITCVAFSCAFWTAVKTYVDALPERQDLDDFILAKEIYYIKNVEAPTLVLDYPETPEQLRAEQARFGFSGDRGKSLAKEPNDEKPTHAGAGTPR